MNKTVQKLKGRTAVITGAAQGIGYAIAERFASEGANVVLADIDVKGAESAATDIATRFTVSTLPLHIDVASANDNAHMVKETIKEFGQLDILVCNAGVVRPTCSIEDITPDQWQQVIDINLMSCIHATTAYIPHAKANRSGRIIYMASVAGQVGGVASEVTYSVTKAGVLCLTKAVARQLGPFNITVNAIAPGAIQTAMTEILQYSPEVKKSIPLERYGDVSDIAAAALYLASDDARYVTGSTLDVNGGIAMR